MADDAGGDAESLDGYAPEPPAWLDEQPVQGPSLSWPLDMGMVMTAIEAIPAAARLAPRPASTPAADRCRPVSLICEGVDGQARDLTAAVAEKLPAGPMLAVWLASAPAKDEIAPWDRPGIAASYRRLAAWATARELDTVADMVTATAERDPSAGLAEDGAPRRVTAAAASEVGLALTMSQAGAARRVDLAVALQHRLAATGAALGEGRIDEDRARVIADATSVLDDEDVVTAVEGQVLPRAPELTVMQLRDAIRHAIMTADPRGADERREKSERRARVTLRADDHGTATLSGFCLPGIHAAAIMARLTALARALKAAGAGGGLDFLRAQTLVGLLLGTLPPIPPPADGPPDDPPPPEDAPPDPESATWRDAPPPGDADAPPEDPADRRGSHRPPWPPSRDRTDDLDDDLRGPLPAWPPLPTTIGPRLPATGRPGQLLPLVPGGRVPPVPADSSGRASAPGPGSRGDPAGWLDFRQNLWRAPDTVARLPPGKRLDLTITWSALTGAATTALQVGRLGPVTAARGRLLALMAALDPTAAWRVIVIGPDGRAIGVERARRRYLAAWKDRPPGVLGRVTVTITTAEASAPLPPGTRSGGIRPAILAAARRAACRGASQAQADEAAAGGCAHTTATPAYRPPVRVRELVEARDQTCRHPGCRQRAWHSDLDHSLPYDQGGLTCPCNLAPRCRTHHQVKQEPGWRLVQPRPGELELTTPAGRVYRTVPDSYPPGEARYDSPVRLSCLTAMSVFLAQVPGG